MKKKQTVRVPIELHIELQHLRADLSVTSLYAVIEILLENYKKSQKSVNNDKETPVQE